jgi:hypothetical protein
MSRKSLLLIAAAVISAPALASTNAFAKGAAAGHAAMPISRPHISTFKPAGKVAAPRATFSSTARLVASTHRSGIINPKDVGKVVKDVTGNANSVGKATLGAEIGKAMLGAEKSVAGTASNPSSFGKAIEAARAAAEKAAQDAAKAQARGSRILQTPADPAQKVGAQIPAKTPGNTPGNTPDNPSRPQNPHETPGGGPKFPGGGVVVTGPGTIPMEPGPVVASSTTTAPPPVATSRAVGAMMDGAPAPRLAGPCNCLVKERLQDGSALFMDVCTKELARSTPANETAMTQDAR